MNLSKLKNVKLKDWILLHNSNKRGGLVGYQFMHYHKPHPSGIKTLQSKTAAGLWKKIEKYLEGL